MGVYDEVWSRPGLSRRDRRFVTLACVCASNNIDDMNEQVYQALSSGDVTETEMYEFVLHFAVYCGWPKGSQAEGVARSQLARVASDRGLPPPTIGDDLPLESLGPTDHAQRLAAGEQCFVDINLVPAPPRDSPYFHAGIIAFVFGHLWQRPGLGRRERRLITVACVGVSDALLPIHSHVGSALASGDLSPAEMHEVILQFAAYSGFSRARVLQEAADAALARTAAG